MIYMKGGAPRAGKSILCQQISAQLGIGWISTDLLLDLLRFKNVEGIKTIDVGTLRPLPRALARLLHAA